MTLTRDTAATSDRAAELAGVVHEIAEQYGAPGLAVAIVLGDDQVVAVTGVTSVENPLPVDPDTLFRVASVTKPVTATALMRLCELGRLDFDAPLRTYLPDLRLADEDAAARVTLRHVVTHRVGVFSDGADFGPGDDALAKAIESFATQPLRAQPGEVFCYSADFRLAGRVIEALTGKTYEAAMRELVFEPLGMTRSCFLATDAITYRVAAGHILKDGTAQVRRPWPETRAGNSTGGLITTANDLTRFMCLHLGRPSTARTDELLSDASLAFMALPLSPDGASGAAWWRYRVDGVDVLDHGGWYPGFIAQLSVIPARGFGLAILGNIERTGAEGGFPERNTLSGKITVWALDAYLGIRVPPDAALPLSDHELTRYTGRFQNDVASVELSISDGQLLVTERPNDPTAIVPEPYRVAFYAADRFFRVDGSFRDTKGEFARDARGDIVWFRPFWTTLFRRVR